MGHRPIVVFGASGHTGRFVVGELRRRGRSIVLAGRDAGALRALADEVRLGIALDSWRPTRGTRRTVERNAGRHVVLTNGRLEPFPSAPREMTWAFAPPLGADLPRRGSRATRRQRAPRVGGGTGHLRGHRADRRRGR